MLWHMLLFGDAFGPAYICYCLVFLHPIMLFLGGGQTLKYAFDRQLRYFIIVSGVHSSVVFNACVYSSMYACMQSTLSVCIQHSVVVVVFFTLTDRASTIPSNILRGCQSGTWSQRGTKVNGSLIMVTTRSTTQKHT